MTRRVVFDTNTLISGYLWGGVPRKALEKTRPEEWQLILSRETINEFIRVLSYKKFNLTASEIQPIIRDLEKRAEFVKIRSHVKIIEEDVSDNLFLSLAIDSGASYIVTGDSHLLNLKRFENVEIVSAKQFIEIVKKSN